MLHRISFKASGVLNKSLSLQSHSKKINKNTFISKTVLQKRSQHTGMWPYAIEMAVIPDGVDGVCRYEGPVGGNGPQAVQHKNGEKGYSIDMLRQIQQSASKKLKDAGVNVTSRETAHLQPVKSAIFSYAGIIPDRILKTLYERVLMSDVLDHEGRLINTFLNQEKIRHFLFDMQLPVAYKETLDKCLKGIFSGYADSIYIANAAFLTNNSFGKKNEYQFTYVPTYPQKAMERRTEHAHDIAYALSNGTMPIILQAAFEGVANLKPLNYLFKINGEIYQLALGYQSSRSELKSIKEINKWQKKLGLPKYHIIKLMPQSGKENELYHKDCAINLCTDKIQYSNEDWSRKQITVTKILSGFKPNGIACIVNNGLDRYSIKFINHAFKSKVYLDPIRDPMIANVVITKNKVGQHVLLISDKMTPENENEMKAMGVEVIKLPNLSFGGGGSWQCMSNAAAQKRPPISPEEWRRFTESHQIKLSQLLYEAVEERYLHLTRKG